jgi:ATP-binding cassette subfamily B protein
MQSEKKESQMQTVQKVFRRLGKYRIYLILSLVLAFITVALTLYIPKLTGMAVDVIVGKGQVKFPALLKIMMTIGICTLITAVSQWLMNVCNNKMTYGIVQDIRNEAFRKIEILPLKYIDGHSYGEVVSRVIADVDQFSDGLLMGFTQLFSGVITILGTFCFMLSVNVRITFVVVLITPVSFGVAAFISKHTYQMFRVQSETRGEQTGLIDEMIGGQKVVQAYGEQEHVLQKFDEINARLGMASLKATFFSSITNPATRFVNSLVYTGVGISGAFAVIGGAMTVGTAFQLFKLCESVYEAVQRDFRCHYGIAECDCVREADF